MHLFQKCHLYDKFSKHKGLYLLILTHDHIKQFKKFKKEKTVAKHLPLVLKEIFKDAL